MSEKWWVGQRVHACAYGDGTVTAIHPSGFKCVVVAFDRGITISFSKDGREYSYHKYPTLFPIDTEPPKPKVKKQWECWKNVRLSRLDGRTLMTDADYPTRERAIAGRSNQGGYLGDPVHVVHEWEE